MKTPFKTIFISSAATLFVFVAALYLSCKPDKCSTVTCYNGGTCSNGNCVCPTGYEGSSCETAGRTKFIGNWQVSNTTTTTEPAKFGVSITADSGLVTNVKISNLHNVFTSVNATISGNNITIPGQKVQGSTVSGEGYIYSTSVYGVNSSISMTYDVMDSTNTTVSEAETWGG